MTTVSLTKLTSGTHMNYRKLRKEAMADARRYKALGVGVVWIKHAVWRARSANRKILLGHK